MAMASENAKIAVVGGGAAGLMAAYTAKKNNVNCKVVVFEAKESCGKKINATGNGRCNFTNLRMDKSFYRGNNPDFVEFGLNAFTCSDAIEFFASIGVPAKDKNGYVYPLSEEAASVSGALRLACVEMGVLLKENTPAEVKCKTTGFLVNGEEFDKCIIACGGFAGIKDRKNFSGYDLVKGLGHKVTPLYPSLCQIRCKEKFFKTINGVRTEAQIKVMADGKELDTEKGEILFTDYGVSGIPAFQASRFCAKAIDEGKKVYLHIDFLPDMSITKLTEDISKRRKFKRSAEEALFGVFNHKLNFVLLNEAHINPTEGAEKAYTTDKISALAKLIKDFRTEVIGTNDFSFAQVVAGGVDTKDINEKTMESAFVKGLYFAGEIMDVDGTCGGYNLQWAWSSGYLAGMNAVTSN